MARWPCSCGARRSPEQPKHSVHHPQACSVCRSMVKEEGRHPSQQQAPRSPCCPAHRDHPAHPATPPPLHACPLRSWLIAIAFWLSGGFIRSGLGARIAYSIVSLFGKTTLGLTYSLVFAEALLAPAIPSVAARAGGLFLPLAKALCLACGKWALRGAGAGGRETQRLWGTLGAWGGGAQGRLALPAGLAGSWCSSCAGRGACFLVPPCAARACNSPPLFLSLPCCLVCGASKPLPPA